MLKYIKTMNKMFADNAYTDGNRVTVEYAPKCGVIVVKVMDKVATIDNIDDYTDFGLMYVVMAKVKQMYDKWEYEDETCPYCNYEDEEA